MSLTLSTRDVRTKVEPGRAYGVLQRACACGSHAPGGECATCRKKREGLMQRSAIGTGPIAEVPPIVGDVLRSPGRPLDAGPRAFMESRFGRDFSGVRIHTDARAADSARAVGATAYTVGRHIVFCGGGFDAASPAGRALLAHELAHTIQQGQKDPGSADRLAIDPDPALEARARSVSEGFRHDRGPVEGDLGSSGLPSLARQPALARPPVRPPNLQLLPGGRSRPGIRPAPERLGDPRLAPQTLEEAIERANVRAARERAIWELEQPTATLARGGGPPDFITEGRPQQAIGEYGTVTYTPRDFHILDAIEHEVSRAQTMEDFERIIDLYIPSLRTSPSRPGLPAPLRPLPLFLPFRIPSNFDSGGTARIATFDAALRRRTRQRPEPTTAQAPATAQARPTGAPDDNTRRGSAQMRFQVQWRGNGRNMDGVNGDRAAARAVEFQKRGNRDVTFSKIARAGLNVGVSRAQAIATLNEVVESVTPRRAREQAGPPQQRQVARISALTNIVTCEGLFTSQMFADQADYPSGRVDVDMCSGVNLRT